jgi:hypothetical protein
MLVNQFSRVQQILTLLSIVAAIAVNTYFQFFPIGGLNIGQISNQILREVLITPANYAFAIWGLIYIGLLGFGVYQLLPAQRENPRLGWARLGVFWASIAQIFWIFAFQLRQFWFSVAYIFVILVFLGIAYIGIRWEQPRFSRPEKWWVQFPLSTYFGWITVATVVNVASALYVSNWNGWGISSPVWTAILMAIAAAITGAIAILFQDVAYSLVTVWALIAIAARHASIPLISYTGIGLAIGILGLLLFMTIRFGPKLR